MRKRKPFDMKAPGAQALANQIWHGAFIQEGTLVAFPLCFPGVTVPIPIDESRVTALAVAPDGMVYGGTSGRRAHLFVGMFHGETGMVMDFGAVADADRSAAVCCGKKRFLACVNGPRGGRILTHEFESLPFSLIQEWSFPRRPCVERGSVAEGEAIRHAVADAAREQVIGATEHRVFAVGFEEGKPAVLGAAPGVGRLALGSAGGIFGRDAGETLWRCDPVKRKLERKAVKLPRGSWAKAPLHWARDAADGRLYVADNAGRLFSFTEEKGFAGPLARTPLAPAGPMAVTHDGRVFGACGEGLGRLFCFQPEAAQVADLGVAVSVLERRRYGYEFAAAATGRDGQLFLGEDDDLGHLWLYFPRIQARR